MVKTINRTFVAAAKSDGIIVCMSDQRGRSLMTGKALFSLALVLSLFLLDARELGAEGTSDAELAKQLANPLADMTSVPLQLNYDQNLNADDSGSRLVLNIQPVFSISLNSDWNLISRSVMPIISQDEVSLGAGHDLGFGDISQSFFFSPKKPAKSGWIWGLGPIINVPTSSGTPYGANEWGLGVTGIALKQAGPWTFGGLASHLTDIEGDVDFRSTFLQPFVAYTLPSAWGVSVNTEAAYDWEAQDWSVPVNFMVSKTTRIGKQPISFQGGIRYWADTTPTGPESWGLRFKMTLVYPKKR